MVSAFAGSSLSGRRKDAFLIPKASLRDWGLLEDKRIVTFHVQSESVQVNSHEIWIHSVWLVQKARIFARASATDAIHSYFSCGSPCGFPPVSCPSSCSCSCSTVVCGLADVFSRRVGDWPWFSGCREALKLHWTRSLSGVKISRCTDWNICAAGLSFGLSSFAGDLMVSFGAGLSESDPWGSTGPPDISTRDILWYSGTVAMKTDWWVEV